jgi:hypothetical protein
MTDNEALAGLITASEGRVREDIRDVRGDVRKLDTRVGAIEASRQLSEQRRRDWFQALGSTKALLVTFTAVCAAVLSLINLVG